MKYLFFTLIYLFFIETCYAQSIEHSKIVSFSFFKNRGYQVLQRICDEAGGRLAGTETNEKALKILQEEGKKDNLVIKFEKFTFPGWKRENDTVLVTSPVLKPLRAIGLGYNSKTGPFDGEVVFASYGYQEDYENLDVKGKIVLVIQERPLNREELLRYEAIEIASRKGALAILFINDKPGGLVLAGVGNFQGNPNPIPAFSITYEDGQWLRRLSTNNLKPVVRIQSNSYCYQATSANAIYTIPGNTNKKIVVGAHFDSWDISQGAIDNGIGIAVLYEIARNLSQFHNYYYTIEFVWFNAEELGLWGSKYYVDKHKDEVSLAINLDMPGDPIGFNIMGFDYLDSVVNAVILQLDGFFLKNGVVSKPWTNSDHMYFMFEGISTITLLGWMDEPMYHHYHDFGDSFEKVNKKYISNASAVLSLLIHNFAQSEFEFRRFPKDEIVKILKNGGLEKRLRKQKEWKFD